MDAKKNRDFYLQETKLNDKLGTDPNLLNGIKGKTQEMLINQPKEEPIFNYNSVDKLTYLEFKKILMNLRISNQLNFDYDESQKTIVQQEAYTRKLQ